uniref:Cyclin C-terminal domain-containing protein n=1 Tax=Ditylenchus dipsaci TaxID=166011 RepID=A0A915EVI7_9BILA
MDQSSQLNQPNGCIDQSSQLNRLNRFAAAHLDLEHNIDKMRIEANKLYQSKCRKFLESSHNEDLLLTPDEEALLRKVFTQTGIRFGDDFRPLIWPSVQWTALAYFKRFYLNQSTMEYFPKYLMITCYYLALKVDEFNLTIDQFVENLRSGEREDNIKAILSLEPEIMLNLDYQLTVHCPFRPFEGHMIDMKTKCRLDFDLDLIRPHSTEFFKKSLVGDAMLLYAPSQIALAALKYGLEQTDQSKNLTQDLLKTYFKKLLDGDQSSVNSLYNRLDEICKVIWEQSRSVLPEQNTALETRKADRNRETNDAALVTK